MTASCVAPGETSERRECQRPCRILPSKGAVDDRSGNISYRVEGYSILGWAGGPPCDQSLGQKGPERQRVNRWEEPSVPCQDLALFCGQGSGFQYWFKERRHQKVTWWS